MAGDDDDLRINTLHRFAKRSPRLVLHEYSHCEVPAGCGGVVLRWIDPAQGTPATVRIQTPDLPATCWLDGERLTTGLTLLKAGPRLLAVHLRRREPGAQLFTISIHHDSDTREADLIQPGGPQWRCTATAPGEGDGWVAIDFDDADWREVPLASARQIAAQESWLRRSFERAAAAGQPVFVIEGAELWLRVAFTAPEAP